MRSPITRLFACCINPSTLDPEPRTAQPTRAAGGARLQNAHAELPAQHADLELSLRQARIALPSGQTLVARTDAEEYRQIHAFLAAAAHAPSPELAAERIILSGNSYAGFRGALTLMGLGLIDRAIPDADRWPGEGWANHLARFGEEPEAGVIDGAVTVDLEQRFRILAASPLPTAGPTREGHTPAFSAAQAGNVATSEALRAINNAPGKAPPPLALHSAAIFGQTQKVTALLARGTPVNTADRDGATALHFASANAHLDTLRVLLERGADPCRADGLGTTPLHLAAMLGHVSVIKALVAAGADVNARDCGDYTPLHQAFGHDRLAAVRALLSAGADPLARNEQGDTPAEIAGRDASISRSRFAGNA